MEQRTDLEVLELPGASTKRGEKCEASEWGA